MALIPSLQDNDLDPSRFNFTVRTLFVTSICICIAISYFIIRNIEKVDYYTSKQNDYINETSRLFEIKSLFFKVAYDIELGTSNHYIINRDINLLQNAIYKLDSSYAHYTPMSTYQKQLDVIKDDFQRLSTIHTRTLAGDKQAVKLHNLLANINNSIDNSLELHDHEYSTILASKSHYNSQNQGYFILNLLLAFGLLGVAFLIADRQLHKSLLYRKLLLKRVEDLNAINQELEQYTYITSHDLQEPTRKIIVLCERMMASSSDQLSEDSTQMLHKIHKSSLRMNILVRDLLQFAKIPNKVLEAQSVSLNHVIETVLYDLQESIVEKKAVIQVEYLPTLALQESQMYQLFSNLISNALKYSRQDISPIIHINHVITKGKYINFASEKDSETEFSKISLTDNGIGFMQEHAERIFKPFQRLHISKDYTGSGIGLAICAKIVKNHGGYLEAEGQLNLGATFVIYLPHR